MRSHLQHVEGAGHMEGMKAFFGRQGHVAEGAISSPIRFMLGLLWFVC